MDTYEIKNGKASILKDPNAILDYSLDWSEWLDGDVILSFVMLCVGVTKTDQDLRNDGTLTVAWLSGGLVDEDASATFRITTALGRVEDRTIFLKIKER